MPMVGENSICGLATASFTECILNRGLIAREGLMVNNLKYDHTPGVGKYGTTVRGAAPPSYSVKAAASDALTLLLSACQAEVPIGYLQNLEGVQFISAKSAAADTPIFPCPMKEQEALGAIRALEGLAAAAIADLRVGDVQRNISVDVSKVGCNLMSSYITTLDSMDKADPRMKDRVPDTDINAAQSVLYRRLSANLYETKTFGHYYHIHGSLEASKTLAMLGLEPHRPDLESYSECLRVIGQAVRRFDVQELEELNARERQAGAPALTRADFANTPHGKAVKRLPPYTVQALETATPRIPFPNTTAELEVHKPGHVLRGIRVIELCRVIAGPVIGRSLAALGASVLKVTSPELPDVPFFQVDVNAGKHTTSLHLRCHEDRVKFEDLLATADVVIGGYRPGSLEHLGYGPDKLIELAQKRGRGIIYVSEDCFGGVGLPAGAGAEWAARPGWQQIADCVTGLAWEQGRFMGLDEPVVPPFPMSDYGTGSLGCVAVLTGLYRRATQGGSWIGRTSLCQYNLFLFSLDPYPREVQDWLRKTHDRAFFDLRHQDSVDEIGRRALKSIRRLHPYLFKDDMMESAWSDAYGGAISWPRDGLQVEGLMIEHVRPSRPNGSDEPTWEGWEVERDIDL